MTNEFVEGFVEEHLDDVTRASLFAAASESSDFIDISNMDSVQWRHSRSKGLGGSDAGTVIGVNHFKGAFQLWMEKTGQIPAANLDDNEAVYWGNQLEDVVAQEFSVRAEVPVYTSPYMFRSKTHPWMLLNVDRLTVDPETGEPALLECKTAGFFAGDEWEGDHIPERYEAQVYHAAHVLGFDHAFIAVLIAGQRFEWRKITLDKTVMANIVKAEQNFWLNHVEAMVPPPPDGSDSCTDVLRDLWPVVDGVADIDETVVSDLRAYVEHRDKANEHNDLKKVAANRIRARLEDKEVGLFNGVQLVSNKQASRTVTDWEGALTEVALALDLSVEDLIEKHSKQSTYRTLRVSSKKLEGVDDDGAF